MDDLSKKLTHPTHPLPSEWFLSEDWTMMKCVTILAFIGSFFCVNYCFHKIMNQYERRLVRFDVFTSAFWIELNIIMQTMSCLMRAESYQIAALLVAAISLASGSMSLFFNSYNIVFDDQLINMNHRYVKYLIIAWPIVPALIQLYWKYMIIILASSNCFLVAVTTVIIIHQTPGSRLAKFKTLLLITLSSGFILCDFSFSNTSHVVFFICKTFKCTYGIIFYIYFKLIFDIPFELPDENNLISLDNANYYLKSTGFVLLSIIVVYTGYHIIDYYINVYTI